MENEHRRVDRGPTLTFSAAFLTLTIFFLSSRATGTELDILVLLLGGCYIAGMFVMGYKCGLDMAGRRRLALVNILFVTVSLIMILSVSYFFLYLNPAYLSALLLWGLFVFWELTSDYARRKFR